MAHPKAFIINVGANASHAPLRSPIFDDGTFFFVPIPEADEGLPRYRDVLPEALPYLPAAYRDERTHNDPEFATFTYGDYPVSTGRAGLLKQITPGDYLCFLARLVMWSRKDGGFMDRAAFYIVGYFEVGEVFQNVPLSPPESVLRAVANNAHVRRLRGPEDYRLWIIKGTSNSRLLRRALPFDRKLADRVMRDTNGDRWSWDPLRTDLQVIGSYTRSCRMISDPDRVAVLLEEVREYAGAGVV
jgi:hypothetical protein